MNTTIDFNVVFPTPVSLFTNLSIAQEYFPDEWKVEKVISIFKDGDPQDIQNYRPISVLCFSKVFEKIFLLIFRFT